MKKRVPLLLMLCACNYLFAQKIETSVQVYSGLFHYAGNGTASTSAMIEGSQNYTDNPYGNKNGFSYGIGIQAQQVSRGGFIIGLQAGYEILRSKVTITSYGNDPNGYNNAGYNGLNPGLGALFSSPATGSSFLQDQSINLSPYIGYRLKLKNMSIDLLPGIDIGLNLSSYDKGEVTLVDNTSTQAQPTYKTDYKRPRAPTDVRIKFGGALNYKKVAFTASYAHGIINYDKNMTGGNYDVHSELIRFGIAYKLSNIH